MVINTPRSRWTAEDLDRLHELARLYTARQVATIMERSFPSVRTKMQREGIYPVKQQNWTEWSHEEIAFLEVNHEKMSAPDMATALKRTEQSIRKKCFALGLSLMHWKYSDEDVRLCRQLFEAGLSREEIAGKMEVPYQRVVQWVSMRARCGE